MIFFGEVNLAVKVLCLLHFLPLIVKKKEKEKGDKENKQINKKLKKRRKEK